MDAHCICGKHMAGSPSWDSQWSFMVRIHHLVLLLDISESVTSFATILFGAKTTMVNIPFSDPTDWWDGTPLRDGLCVIVKSFSPQRSKYLQCKH